MTNSTHRGPGDPRSSSGTGRAIATLDPAQGPVVLEELAAALARECCGGMDGYRWSARNVRAARRVLAGPGGAGLVHELAQRLSGYGRLQAPGWVVVTLPPALDDDGLVRAASGVLAAVGAPFNSIDDGGRLWIGGESSIGRDEASFGGVGAQGLHIDAPNVEHVPRYTALLVLRADPGGGGASLVGDLRAAAAALTDAERAPLQRPIWFEGHAEGLSGVGRPRLPFPVLEVDDQGQPVWIRWAAKILHDPRNTGPTAALRRFADELARTVTSLPLTRGQLLILDQQRAAHGRTALGPQGDLPPGACRCLLQAKAGPDLTAPMWAAAGVRGGGD